MVALRLHEQYAPDTFYRVADDAITPCVESVLLVSNSDCQGISLDWT